MKTSEILKAAEKHLWDGKNRDAPQSIYICFAIDRAFGHSSFQEKKDYLRSLITKRIGCLSYADWACNNGFLPLDWTDNLKYWRPILQANRLNWLRELQREFREKGD